MVIFDGARSDIGGLLDMIKSKAWSWVVEGASQKISQHTHYAHNYRTRYAQQEHLCYCLVASAQIAR